MSASRPVTGDITVVIPTVGRTILRRCLEALAEGESWPARVVIVDQGRMAEVAALVEEFRSRGLDVVYVPSSATGRSAGLNTGIARAETPFVAVTDDDCVAAPNWVARMAARLRERAPAIVTGRVEAGEGEAVPFLVTSNLPLVQRRPALRFDRLSGGNMGMPTVLATQVGPFDEDSCVRTAEDAEFAYRALRAGIPIAYSPDIAVWHLGWRDATQREAQYRNYARSQGGFYGKYLRHGDLFMVLRAGTHLLRSLRRWIRGRLIGDRELARNGRAYVVGLLPGMAAGFRGRNTR